MNEYGFHCKREIMNQVLEVRYTHLEEERALCMGLLEWATETDDLYAKAFANTYLGDFYLAQNEGERALRCLLEARTLLENEQTYPELWLRLLCFLAICFDLEANEALSIQYYMEAIVLANELGDKVTELLVCNNVALAFQKHNSLHEALRYYMQAYALLETMEVAQLKAALLTNLAEVSVRLNQFEEAHSFILQCNDVLEDGSREQKEFEIRNWCIYYGAQDNEAEASRWAHEALEHADCYFENRFSAFENFHAFFHTMLRIRNQQYAKGFLDLQESMSPEIGLEQRFLLEKNKLEYCLLFEPEENHLAAYRRLYKESSKLRSSGNKIIVNAMKGRLHLEEALVRRERLILEQANLTYQADVDELSRLYNRGYLERMLRDKCYAKKSMGTIMLDIDYFKEYNDFYGHMEGDKVITAVGESLLENQREGIYACRYGGDEFACILCDVSSLEVEHFIKRVQKSLLAKAISHEKSKCSSVVTLSIGYAAARLEEDETLYYLLQNADGALYRTKLSGRNGFSGEVKGEV